MAQRPLLTPTIVGVFPVFGSKILQLNQICIFSSDYTEDFLVYSKTLRVLLRKRFNGRVFL
ncbi:hypothetical protein C0J52_01095 [Blattella germanica]|nr:hypothetical protein C0J52_01095 [Blattella germanica]